jgi:hypothetical protein
LIDAGANGHAITRLGELGAGIDGAGWIIGRTVGGVEAFESDNSAQI